MIYRTGNIIDLIKSASGNDGIRLSIEGASVRYDAVAIPVYPRSVQSERKMRGSTGLSRQIFKMHPSLAKLAGIMEAEDDRANRPSIIGMKDGIRYFTMPIGRSSRDYGPRTIKERFRDQEPADEMPGWMFKPQLDIISQSVDYLASISSAHGYKFIVTLPNCEGSQHLKDSIKSEMQNRLNINFMCITPNQELPIQPQ